ncbi:hypothetical protein PS1_033144 [Malus domestica]
MVKPAFSICFSNPPCLLRLADPRHRRSRLCPILLSPPSSYSSFLRLWNPSVIFLACKALALSIETKTCFSSAEEHEKGRTSIRRSSQTSKP